MKIAKEQKEVPLPSQEGTKGVVQYALYVKCMEIFVESVREANNMVQNNTRYYRQLGATRLVMAYDFRSGMLRRRNDALVHAEI
jgi:hypothetical protein